MQKNVLITGGAGFVGSNLAFYLKKQLKDCRIVCFDNLIRRGSELNVPRLKNAGITFIQGDIRRKSEIFKLTNIDCIIDCSAEPAVTAAYKNPNYTIDTNLIGTINCLELAKTQKADLIFLSTSRVYPIKTIENLPFEKLPTRFDWPKNLKGQGYSYAGINEQFPLKF